MADSDDEVETDTMNQHLNTATIQLKAYKDYENNLKKDQDPPLRPILTNILQLQVCLKNTYVLLQLVYLVSGYLAKQDHLYHITTTVKVATIKG